MAPKHTTVFYRNLYRKLVHLYPKAFRERFAEAMMQTFDDLCCEKQHEQGGSMVSFALGMFSDTAISIIGEYLEIMTNTIKNTPIEILGLILLIPFSLLFLAGMAWQLLNALGYAGSPDLGAFIPNRDAGYALIFIFPLIAFLINFITLIVGAIRAGPSAALSIQFAKTHLFTLVIVVLSAGATLFIFGHDVIPCFVHGVLREGPNNIWPLIKTCGNA
jgi:hypothetical protein